MIKQSAESLASYIEGERYAGYDPYDTLTSPINFGALGKWGAAIAVQAGKKCPVNLRPLLGIHKDINPKAMGLFLKAYCLRYQQSQDLKQKEFADALFTWLLNHTSQGYGCACWGYNFDWANPDENLKAFTPSVVVTGFVIDGIFEYYKTFNNKAAREVIKSACDFIINKLAITELSHGISIAYTAKSKGCCYNASLLGAETLIKGYCLVGRQEFLELAQGAIKFVLHQQKADGRWNYSYDPETGKEREQVDFHQGFILLSLHHCLRNLGRSWPEVEQAIEKGLTFYWNEQFFPNGRAKWRLPKIFPADIHHQAQGIITFSELAYLQPKYLQSAKVVADWTIKEMQDKRGYFYYRKHRFYTCKIPYIRWGQAWMLLALTELLKAEQDGCR